MHILQPLHTHRMKIKIYFPNWRKSNLKLISNIKIHQEILLITGQLVISDDIRFYWIISWGHDIFSADPPGVKWLGHEAEHSPPASADVKKMWIYTFTPPYALMA
jgi:hypothetical protein